MSRKSRLELGGQRILSPVKKWAAIAAIIGVVAVTAVGIQLVRMHDTYGEWRLTATETPTRITALDRDYDRSNLKPKSAPPSGLERRGETEGGGTILVPEGLKGRTPVVIYVQDDEGRVWSYGLVGGP